MCKCEIVPNFDSETIPLDCEETFQMMSDSPLGIFQLEGPTARKWIPKFKPNSLEELSDFIALDRTGPIQAGMMDEYLAVKNEEKEMEFLHPNLRPILGKTKSAMVYQEQVLEICRDIAGLSLSEADTIRKAIGKKKADLMAECKVTFVNGCLKNNYSQEIADKLWEQIDKMSGYQFNKCLHGDTLIQRSHNKHGSSFVSIGHLWKLVNNKEYAKVCNQMSLRKKLKHYGYGKCMAMGSDGRIRPYPIKDIHYNGPRELYIITNMRGDSIISTLDHKFMTHDGMKPISEVEVMKYAVFVHRNQYDSSSVYNYNVHDETARGNKNKLIDTIGRANYGFIDGNWSALEKIKTDYEDIKNCEECGSKGKLEWHHKDRDRKNNVRENLEKLCIPCHKKKEYILGRNKQWEKGHVVDTSYIVSIEYYGISDTYDVEMATEEHNFVANGFVVSNSHSLCYAMLAYKTAWAKTHFTTQFYTALLRKAGSGVKEQGQEILSIINDAKLNNIEVCPPTISRCNLDFEIMDDKKIAFGLGHIKGIGKSSVSDIVKCKSKTWNEFIIKVINNNIKKTVVEGLIWSGALDEFKRGRFDMAADFGLINQLTEKEIDEIKTNIESGRPIFDELKRISEVTTIENRKLSGEYTPTKRRCLTLKELLSGAEELKKSSNFSLALAKEKFFIGITISGNESDLYNSKYSADDCINFAKAPSGTRFKFICMIEKVREHIDKNKNKMAFLTISDSTYMIDAVIFASSFSRFGCFIQPEKVIMVNGRKQDSSLIVDSVKELC